jgi:predicted RNA-binding Zn-ribbon protein involved in translation (DUF1610 family)
MAEWFSCFSCHKVAPLIGTAEKKCPACGSTNGEILSHQRFKEGYEAGVYYDLV